MDGKVVVVTGAGSGMGKSMVEEFVAAGARVVALDINETKAKEVVAALDPKDRARTDVARKWIEHLVTAIRKSDERTLITVGLVDWSLERKGLTSGFVPEKVCEKLDFVCVHIYPETGKLDDAAKTLKGFAVGKPVVVEETFPLKCSPKDLEAFIEKTGPDAAGWISFYWGTPPEKLRQSKEIKDAILFDWLERFQKRAPRSANE